MFLLRSFNSVKLQLLPLRFKNDISPFCFIILQNVFCFVVFSQFTLYIFKELEAGNLDIKLPILLIFYRHFHLASSQV